MWTYLYIYLYIHSLYIYIYIYIVYIYMCGYIYIYIYIYRERHLFVSRNTQLDSSELPSEQLGHKSGHHAWPIETLPL